MASPPVSFPSPVSQAKSNSFHSALLSCLFNLTYELYDASDSMQCLVNRPDDAFVRAGRAREA